MGDHGSAFFRLQDALTAAAQQGPIRDLTDLAFQMQQREAIHHEFAVLEQALRQCRHQFEHLPALPDVTCIRWAQNVLASPAGRLLLVDTVFPTKTASIIQMLVLDFAGGVRWCQTVAAECRPDSGDLHMLGISLLDLQEAVPLPHLWSAFLAEFNGCYVLGDDLPRMQTVLEQEAARYHLDPPVLVGDSLLPWYARFYLASGMIGLASLCHLIGQPLPAIPTARERAQGHLALLRAMAQGMTGTHPSEHCCETSLCEEERTD